MPDRTIYDCICGCPPLVLVSGHWQDLDHWVACGQEQESEELAYSSCCWSGPIRSTRQGAIDDWNHLMKLARLGMKHEREAD